MEHQEGAREPRRCAREGGEPIQFKSELPSLSPTRSPGPPRIQIDVQIVYDLRFGHSTHSRKDKEITFPMAPVSCPTKMESSATIKTILISITVFGAEPPFWVDWPCIQ
jgi:hypothetical protein